MGTCECERGRGRREREREGGRRTYKLEPEDVALVVKRDVPAPHILPYTPATAEAVKKQGQKIFYERAME